MSDFQKFKEQRPRKEKFYRSLTAKKVSDKEYENVLKVWSKFETKMMKDYHHLHLRCDMTGFFEKFRNNGMWIMSKLLCECKS